MGLKDYTFNTKEDFIHYIYHLVVGISNSINSFEMQLNDLGDYITERNLIEKKRRLVSAKVYERYCYLLGSPFDNLLNLFGDNAAYGSSYKNYRKNVKKKGSSLGITYMKFTPEQEERLNEVTTARDWASHVAVSLIHSTEDKAFDNKIDTREPIYISLPENYPGFRLVKLYIEHYESLLSFKELFCLLKKDYEELTGTPCIVLRESHHLSDIGELTVASISAGIQTKKVKTIEDIQRIYKENPHV
ncbi:hypothetical protein [Oceanobacillus picturae]|uniref:hypothetical protein n=1 Tax=Oceanobacillus picturae TaxID=171693 RepID=UPI000E6A32C7|nr:hypothetical protein [Oceanobacillus picturae]RIU93311.1 hypothetical protein D1864_07510 [Oceanobacillus picturae]